MAGGDEGKHREWGAHDTQGETKATIVGRSGLELLGTQGQLMRHRGALRTGRGIQRQPSCGAVHGLKEIKATIGALRAEGCCELLPSGGCWGLAATSYLRWCRHGGARSLASPTSWGCQCQATGSPFGCLICPTQRVAPCPKCKGCAAAEDGGGGWSRPDGACKPEQQRGWPDISFEVVTGEE